MRLYTFSVVLALLFAGVLSSAGLAAEPPPAQKGKIDVYKYWPWDAGMTWQGAEIKEGFFGENYTIKSLGPSKDAEIQVLWSGGWLDHYRETEKGLERPMDIDTMGEVYGKYDPPAIQYPHYTKLGELFHRTALRTNYSRTDNHPLSSENEDMTYVALGFEDVSVPAGKFKNCLMQLRDYKTIEKAGMEHRKISISWNAEGVGQVRGCVTEFRGGKMIKNFCGELVKLEKNGK